MPFLGYTPDNTFHTLSKQTITGDGGTSYTLTNPVVGSNDIEVFVNNVRQEPGVAYTASGTNITFTENIQVSDSVYIVFQGKAVGLNTIPDGTIGTNKLADGSVTTDKLADIDVLPDQTGNSGKYLTTDGANASWASTGAADDIFWENGTTITANYTITSGKNAGTFGPVTIADGVTVEIPDGSTWTVI